MSERELIPLSNVAPESVEWLWTDRIPLGGITILDGDPGDGKSTIMYDLSARVTKGRPMPITENVIGPAGVVLLQAEDLLGATVRPNIEAAGGDVSRICVYDRRHFSEKPLCLPDDKEIMEKAIREVDAKLVVIDPLPAFLGGNPNSEASARKAFSELAYIAEEMNVAIVIVRHLTKGRSSNTKYRGSGSIGIIAAARSSLFVGHDPSSDDRHRHVLALNKSNLADAASLTYRTVQQDTAIIVEWIGENTHTVNDLSESCDHFANSQLEEACYVLYSILAESDKRMSAKDVQQKAGAALVSPRTLKRAKKKLGITSRRITVQSVTGGDPSIQWVWELPEADALLRPYRERAMKEKMQDGPPDDIDEVTQTIPEMTAEPEESLTEVNDLRWEDDEVCDPTPEPVLDLPGSRPWDD